MSRAAAAALLALLALSGPARASDYEDGMAARRRGDYEAARTAFERMRAKDPDAAGALEGLTLVALAQRRYDEALGYLERWQKKGDSAYLEGFKARAYAGLHREDELVEALLKQCALEPRDARPCDRAEDLLRADGSGVFPRAKIYKTLSAEELETPHPQRIVYEGRSIGVDARARVRGGFSSGLSVTGGASVRQESQRNDTGGFSYYDVLEQVYSMGLEGRSPRARWSASYGQSLFSDIHGSGIDASKFSRASVSGQASLGPVTLRASARRAPYFLRGAAGSSFITLLREDSAKVEAEASWWDWMFQARGAVLDYSGPTTLRAGSLAASREGVLGERSVFQAHLTRAYQEFYGAGADGRLAAMPYGGAGAFARLGDEGAWQAGASYDYSRYRDGNRLHAGTADARLWLPRALLPEWSAAYRYRVADYLVADPSYRSIDEHEHWAGPVWRRRWAAGLWTQLTLEHGWLFDRSRSHYEGNAAAAKVEWRRGRAFSLAADGRVGRDTARDESYIATLTARWWF